MIDQYSKWIELAPLVEQSIGSVAVKFLTHFIATFGVQLICHDFDGNLFKVFQI